MEQQGKLEDAAEKLEMGCALSPSDEPCPASDQKAAEMWQKAAEKAVSEGRYRDAERLFRRAMLTADDATRTAITARLSQDDMAAGLKYERAMMLTDKAAMAVLLEEVSKRTAPASAKAKEWLEKERPALFVARVLSACAPRPASAPKAPREGSCSKAWAALQASGAKGPEVEKAQAAAEAEARRVYPLLLQAERFLPLFAARYRQKDEYEKCIAGLSSEETATGASDCRLKVYGGDNNEDDRFDAHKNEDNLFRRTLLQIGDPALTDGLDERRRAAESRGEYTKQDPPKPKPAPKKP